MKVGIVGLGLIGGSMAKAYAQTGEHEVYGADIDKTIQEFAVLSGACKGVLDDQTIGQCDLILVAVYPDTAVAWVQENAARIRPGTMLIDLCGTKRTVCAACFPIAEKYGFLYVGGHPMAGTHNSGFKYSRADMFRGAPMVLVPPEGFDMNLLDRVKTILAPAGFGTLPVTTAEEHDRMIAFTSQMCHVVSNAYVKSPTARKNKGFSAGSYKDMTRVAWLNPDMWTSLILENKDNVLEEMDVLLKNLQDYRDAIAAEDDSTLRQLLEDGKRIKEEVDMQ